MKSLETVQKWMNAFRIICKILLIICIVGGVLCILGATFGERAMGTVATYGDVSIVGLIDEDGINAGVLRAVLTCAVVGCVSLAVLFGIAAKYLKRELADGTPFTYDFSKNMRTLAILALVLPIASDFISSFIANAAGLTDEVGTKFDIIPVLLLFAASAVFKYGADVLDRKEDTPYAEN